MTTNASELAARAATADLDLDRAILALWPTAFRIASLIVRDAEAAKDIAQEACVRALRHRSQLRDPDAVAPWFRALVANAALAERRKRDRRERREAAYVDGATTVPADVAEVVSLADALARLGDDLRLPLVLFYYGGFTSAEIGKRLGIPAATVRYRLATARATLRPLLGDEA
jgi:RNA polymerase sigma-70 factor (ECF subfamily)